MEGPNTSFCARNESVSSYRLGILAAGRGGGGGGGSRGDMASPFLMSLYVIHAM